jgi:hypothetical protein
MSKFLYKTVLLSVVAFLTACGDASQGQLGPRPDGADGSTVVPPDAGMDVPPVADNPCARADDLHATVCFDAPQPRGPGYLEMAAEAKYPSMANRPDLVLADPYCVAAYATDNRLCCDLGAAYEGTRIYYLTGLGDGSKTKPMSAVFSEKVGDKIANYGEHAVCVGTRVAGRFKGGKFEGALAQSDQPASPYLLFTVPKP